MVHPEAGVPEGEYHTSRSRVGLRCPYGAQQDSSYILLIQRVETELLQAHLQQGTVNVQVVRRIDVPCRDVMWNDSGEMVAILSESSFYVLRFDREAVDTAFESGSTIEEDGIEEAFELLNEVSEHVRTGTANWLQMWLHGECW